MWDWLDSGGPYSRGMAYPFVVIGLLIAGFLFAFYGLSVLRTRSANIELAGSSIALSGTKAQVCGWALTILGATCLVLAITVVL